ncbi:TPA: SemiSWEET family sugar transporter [Streptococcus suis]|uniref:SemiSWEET transporter n=1 Tax=Streptococcus TaxID=1301 RepID=UPI001ABC070D|nr:MULTISPECIES: SemiSWEET transporter [Streptococcus]MBO3641971.1 SemiSWEET family sugar transporter [Streptococcus suis]MBY0719971.1 SemiSWEET transporter [Streptococcus sp. 2018110]MCO8206947.1 SemiSWEET transporter [Streptococcus suis]MCO8211431.1 SemiSWEET transporter [Streptococcus suis]MCO8235505.1 SemiSWEET transporter [Streptococcus suis]
MIGFVAACLTTFGFLPQVIKVVKTKDTEAISLGMYSMSVAGIGLWLIHGVIIGDLALMLANGMSFILSGIILFYKIKYK